MNVQEILKTPRARTLIFVAVLLVGAVIWKLGVNYLEQPAEDPYEIQKMEVQPL
jgi:hypothetical protein